MLVSILVFGPFLLAIPKCLHRIPAKVARHTSEKVALTGLLSVLTFALTLFGFDFNITDMAVHLFLSLPNSRAVELEGVYNTIRNDGQCLWLTSI